MSKLSLGARIVLTKEFSEHNFKIYHINFKRDIQILEIDIVYE